MNKYLCLLAFLFLCCRSSEIRLGAQQLPIAGARPILVITERDPWRRVIDSESPVFALYDDGTVVYRHQDSTINESYQSRTVPDAAGLAKALVAFDSADIKSFYMISPLDLGHDPATFIWTPTRTVEIHGDWRNRPEIDSIMLEVDEGDTLGSELAEQDRKHWEEAVEMWESLPSEIRAALLRIDHERAVLGRSWLPLTVEVMLSQWQRAPGESIIWPDEWPGLYAVETRRRGGDSYSVYLPSGKLAELRSFLATRKHGSAVLIDGRKMSAAIRFPFPGEDAWMR